MFARRSLNIATALALVLTPHAALAVDTSDYLLLPNVDPGEHELDLRGGFASSGPSVNPQDDLALGYGFGATEHWFTEWAIRFSRRQDKSTDFKDVSWENIVQLAEPGEGPIDLGVVLEMEHANQNDGKLELLTGLLMQKEFGKYQTNLNVLLSHVHDNGQPVNNRIGMQWQVKYRYSEPLEFGIQGFDNVSSPQNTWASYPNQNHRLGPVVLGRLKFQHERALVYNAAVLFGTTAHSADYTLRFQIEYEFQPKR